MGEGKKRKIPSLIAYLVFGILSTLIVAESAVPSDASGKQSFGISVIMANIINAFTPPKKTVTASPTGISVASSLTSAKDGEGVSHNLFEADEAIVGTTRLFSYKLSYAEPKADVYLSSVKLDLLSSPGEGSYTSTLSPSSSAAGTLRIIPLLEGDYSFRLTDASGHTADFGFEAKPRKAPGSVKAYESLTIAKGEASVFPFAMDFYDLSRTDGSTDHYLARYLNPDLAEFSSSDESVFTIGESGRIVGVGEGEASVLFNGKTLTKVKVKGEKEPTDIASIVLENEKPCVSRLDYDYSGYGSQVIPHYFDSDGKELFFQEGEEPSLLYSSSDPLVAMVRNDHLEEVSGELVPVKGGFVSGYRNLGKTTISARLAENPSVQAEIEVESKNVDPTSALFSLASSGKPVASGSSLQTGKTLSISAKFEPQNCANKAIHVDISDDTLAHVNNNDSNSPTISLLKDGNLTVSVYSLALGEAGKTTFDITVTPRETISDKDMTDFAGFMRKALGHFMLFLITGAAQALAFFLTLTSKKRELLIYGGVALLTGFSLAGISEAIQAIPSLHRGATWGDIGIDTLGYFVGVLLVYLVFLLVYLVKGKSAKNELADSK